MNRKLASPRHSTTRGSQRLLGFGKVQQEQLRALAQCNGWDLLIFLKQAVQRHQWKTEELLGIKSWQAVHLTKKQRMEMAWRARRLNNAVDNAGREAFWRPSLNADLASWLPADQEPSARMLCARG